MIVSTVGLGVSLAFSTPGVLLKEDPFVIVAAISLIPFVIGLGLIVNGLLLSLPKTGMADVSAGAHSQSELGVPQPN